MDSEAHCRGLQRRAAIRGGGVTIIMNLRMLGRVEVVDKHQWLTVVHAPLTIEAGDHCGGLAACTRARQRRPKPDTDASPRRRRVPWLK